MNLSMMRKPISPILGSILAASLALAASVYSLYHSYDSEINAHREVLVSRGQTVLDALKAGILAHGRMGRYRPERLSVIFEELAQTPDILSLQLLGPEGNIIASGGQQTPLPKNAGQILSWQGNQLTMWADFAGCAPEAGGGGMGRGSGGEGEAWISFPQGVSALAAVIDTSSMAGLIQRGRIQLTVSVVVVATAISLGMAVFLLTLKRSALAGELELEREHARRQEHIALLGAGLAHETKNPLGIVRGLAQSMAICPHRRCERSDHAQQIIDEVDRVIRGMNAFLAVMRPKAAAQVPVDLDLFWDRFLPLVQMDATAAAVQLEYTPTKMHIVADEDLLRRALLNLLLNAFLASSPGGIVRINITEYPDGISIAICDAGCGIVEEDLPHVTEPYFTKFPGGSGLGLPMVEQIAAAHGWRLGIDSTPGTGTCVRLSGIRKAD